MHIDMERFGLAKDVKAELIAATAKALEQIRIPRNRVLVGSYVQSLITPGGVHLTARTLDEDRFQGKCGLVLKMGPSAFRYDDDPDGDHGAKIGEWVLYRPGDTFEVGVGEGAPCRFIFDDQIIAFDVNPKDYY